MAIEDIVINATAKQIEDMATRQISQEITEDSSVDELASAKAVYDAVKNSGTGGGTGDGLEPLIVELEYDDKGALKLEGVANHNSVDIHNHRILGGQVFISTYGVLNDVCSSNEQQALYTISDWAGTVVLTVDSDGNYTFIATQWVSKDELGDLDAALAEILDYAQSLTGGGES